MRKLKHHEKKLLKKVDFFHYKNEKTVQEMAVIRRFQIHNREDYMKYNKLSHSISNLAEELKNLPVDDEYRTSATDQLLDKLYSMGLIDGKQNLEQAKNISVSTFCRRRLPVMLVKLQFVTKLKEATELVMAGHVRVGAEVVTDTAMLITREMEDYISWLNSSKIKRYIQNYNNEMDDYDLLFA
eukprot:snap_masked-scaffold_12-processed-gene-10.26-mRNA-1 protein AED:0.03 eAED:0.03 QI:0/-1/0/1/-1/1/1/0/183